MKKLVLVCAVAAMIAATRSAGAAPPPPPMTWTGCYIGGNFGLVKQDTKIFDPEEQFDAGTSNGIGGAGGIQGGCDYQVNANWVVGVRGMFDWTGVDQSFPWPVLQKNSWASGLTGLLPRLGELVISLDRICWCT